MAQGEDVDEVAQASAYQQLTFSYVALGDLKQAETMTVRIRDAFNPEIMSIKANAQADVAKALVVAGDNQAALDLVATIRTPVARAKALASIAKALAPKDLAQAEPMRVTQPNAL